MTVIHQLPLILMMLKRQPVDYEKLRQFYEKMNFRKFLAELNASGAGQGSADVEKVEYTVLNGRQR